jgi:cytochrome c oxidase subunit 3
MSTMPASLELEKHGGGGGGRVPPPRGGDGGGARGDDAPDFRERLNRYRLGMAIGLIGVIMVFVSLTSAYIVRQGTTTRDPNTGIETVDWLPITLPTSALVLNTLLLMASSVALEMARRSLKRQYAVAEAVGDSEAQAPAPWLAISVLLGAGFLAGQLFVWSELRRRGVYLPTNPSSSFFYLLTALHGVHLLGGMIALGYAQATAWFHRSIAQRLLVVDVTGIYWHFMALLWLYIFGLFQFVK